MICDGECTACSGEWIDCDCGRGRYLDCRHSSCYECYLDRRADYITCILCGRWHSPAFDTCFKCRPLTRGRDDAARELRQLILHRDRYRCRTCGASEGDIQPDFKSREIHATLQVDHIVPCARGGTADEWNLQVLCGVDNRAKGSTWYVGCRHEDVRTRLARSYFLLGPSYFGADELRRFRDEVSAWRTSGTWDPLTHKRLGLRADEPREAQLTGEATR